MNARRGRGGTAGRGNPRSAFMRGADAHPSTGVHPSMLKQARTSGQLNLSGRGLTSVPESVYRINIDIPEDCQHIELASSADERWWDQVDLTKLILASNALEELSDDIRMLPALTVLDLHDNRLVSLPKALAELSHLQKLILSHNQLTELPECVSSLVNLTSLHADHNKLMSLCDDIGNLSKLEDMNISNNQLSSLPESVSGLKHLVKMNLSNNSLKEVPSEIGALQSLQVLDLQQNDLECLPDGFSYLRKLEQLYLRHNNLKDIPALDNCKSLKELQLGNNYIKEITSAQLESISNVCILDLRDNQISKLPDDIVSLQSLERLDVSNNDLTGLPFELGALDNLKSIVLEGNPLKSIRRDIIKRGTVELKKYLKSRITNAESVSINAAKPSNDFTVDQGSGDQPLNIHDMTQFKTLDYSGKQVSEVPNDVWENAAGANVTSVNLNRNKLQTLPQNMTSLVGSLKELYLGINKFSFLSPDIGLYVKLTTLDLRGNSLTDLPNELTSLQNMREIILSLNRLTKLPDVLYDLPRLEILFADDNQINVIDVDGLLKLQKLGTLDLRNNSINQVPPELGNCTWIRCIELGGNPFRNPRPAVLARGTEGLLEFLRSRIVT